MVSNSFSSPSRVLGGKNSNEKMGRLLSMISSMRIRQMVRGSCKPKERRGRRQIGRRPRVRPCRSSARLTPREKFPADSVRTARRRNSVSVLVVVRPEPRAAFAKRPRSGRSVEVEVLRRLLLEPEAAVLGCFLQEVRRLLEEVLGGLLGRVVVKRGPGLGSRPRAAHDRLV